MIRLPKVEIRKRCRKCKGRFSFMAWADDWDAWKRGELLIQDAFWYISEGERELLLSRICGKCWDKMFSNLDNDEE